MAAFRVHLLLLCALLLATIPTHLSAQEGKALAKWEYGVLRHDGRSFAAWFSGKGSVRGKDWDELAEKLNAPALKEELLREINIIEADSLKNVRVLNHLGDQGWEMISHNGQGGGSLWVFKRRVKE